MKRIILAGFALAFLSFAFTTNAQEPGSPMGPDPAPIVSPDTRDDALPAQANKNLRSKRQESVGEVVAAWVVLLIGAGLIAGISLTVYHSVRKVDQGKGGIHRPNVHYQGGSKKTT